MEYPIEFIKSACDRLRGKFIAPRTWTGYLRLCGIKRWAKLVTEAEAAYLLTLARLKKEQCNKQWTRFHILRELRNPTVRMQINQAIADVFHLEAYGRDLPVIIRQCCEVNVSLRTIYRWAEKHKIKFSAGEKLTRTEVERWLAIVSQWKEKNNAA